MPPAHPPLPTRAQALGLGEWLRARYGPGGYGLLPPTYAPGVLAAHTTKFARTRATLRGVLTGAGAAAGGMGLRQEVPNAAALGSRDRARRGRKEPTPLLALPLSPQNGQLQLQSRWLLCCSPVSKQPAAPTQPA